MGDDELTASDERDRFGAIPGHSHVGARLSVAD